MKLFPTPQMLSPLVEINEMLLLQLKENLEGGRGGEGGKTREESKEKKSTFFS